MKYPLFLLIITISACSVSCSRPIIRVPRDAETTGLYIVVLQEDTSHERLLEVVELLRTNLSDGCKIHGYLDTVVKAVLLDLSYDALQKVIYTN